MNERALSSVAISRRAAVLVGRLIRCGRYATLKQTIDSTASLRCKLSSQRQDRRIDCDLPPSLGHTACVNAPNSLSYEILMTIACNCDSSACPVLTSILFCLSEIITADTLSRGRWGGDLPSDWESGVWLSFCQEPQQFAAGFVEQTADQTDCHWKFRWAVEGPVLPPWPHTLPWHSAIQYVHRRNPLERLHLGDSLAGNAQSRAWTSSAMRMRRKI